MAELPLKFTKLEKTSDSFPPSPSVSSLDTSGIQRRYAFATELVYVDANEGGKDQYGSSSVPIYQTATFKQSSSRGGEQEYDYSRSGNPTRSHLERHLAKIMSAQRALCVSSGMAALDVITRLLNPGDHVVTGDDLYGGKKSASENN